MNLKDFTDKMVENGEGILNEDVYEIRSVTVKAYNKFATNFTEITIQYEGYEEDDGVCRGRFARDYTETSNKLI